MVYTVQFRYKQNKNKHFTTLNFVFNHLLVPLIGNEYPWDIEYNKFLKSILDDRLCPRIITRVDEAFSSFFSINLEKKLQKNKTKKF